jgi:hypothetical protein
MSGKDDDAKTGGRGEAVGRRPGAPPAAEGGAKTARAAQLSQLAVHPGLCATCAHLHLLASARSVFVRCGLAATNAAFPRYPPLPVLRCAGYRPL